MKTINSFSNSRFTNNPFLRTFALSISGKLFTPLSLYGGICINGSIEGLTLCVEKGFSLATGQVPSEKMKVFINGAITTAALAALFFFTLFYPPNSATFIVGIGIKLLACRVLFLFCQTIAMSVFTNKKIDFNKTDSKEDTLLHLDEWVKMSGFEQSHVLAKQRIREFLASNSLSLDLGNLNLSSLPDIFNDPHFNQLQVLILENNELTRLPESLGQLQALKKLDVSYNKLTRLPESLGQLRALKRLSFLYNRNLSGIPDAILQLSHDCEVDLTGCGLSANVIERLREQMEADAYSGPRISYSIADARTNVEEKSIQELLNDLYGIIEQPPKTFKNLQESPELRSWLSRLADTADYKASKGLQKAFAEKIIEYLDQANDDAEFRIIFYQVIADASTTCGDRVTLSILHLSIAHQLAAIDLKHMKNLANFLIKGPWTLQMLEAAAREKVQTLPFFDEIEVYLGLPIYLKDALEIPIDVKNMLYFRCSALKEKDLEKAKHAVLKQRNDPEKRLNFLVNHATWRKALEKNYPQEYQAIIEKRDKSSEPLNPDYMSIDETFKEALKTLTQKALLT